MNHPKKKSMAKSTATSTMSNSNNKKEQTVWERSLAAAFRGGLAGFLVMILQVVLLLWLRTTVNYQYKNGGTMMEAMSALWEEGGLRRFYRGFWVALLQAPLVRFGDTAANEGTREFFSKQTKIPTWAVTLLASVTASSWRLFLTPLDNIKTNLQVSGTQGLTLLFGKIHQFGMFHLWDGALGLVAAGLIGHYPWFLVNNQLEAWIPKTEDVKFKTIRNAFIGLCCSIVADTASNFVRVIKTVKQTTIHVNHSYFSAAMDVVEQVGWTGLMTRGLGTKLFTNIISSIIFSVLWKSTMEYLTKSNYGRSWRSSLPSPRTTNTKLTSFLPAKRRWQRLVTAFGLFVLAPASILVQARNLRRANQASSEPSDADLPRLLTEVVALDTVNKRPPRILVVMAKSRWYLNGDNTHPAFGNYGDQLMYYTIFGHCRRLNVECKLSPGGPSTQTDEFKSVVSNWKPDAAWYALGYAFSSKFGFPFKATLPQIEYLKSKGVKHVALLPQAVGPFDSETVEYTKSLFHSFDYIAVRESASYKYLKEVDPNLDVNIIQDTVLSKPLEVSDVSKVAGSSGLCMPERPDGPLIGFSLSRKMKSEMDEGGVFDKEVRGVLSALTLNATVVLLPHEQMMRSRLVDDLKLTRNYYSIARKELEIPENKIFLCDLSPQQVPLMENVIAKLDVLVVMRYHTMVVATREGVPTAPYSWAPKYSELLNDAGIGEEYLLNFGDSQKSVQTIWTLYDNRSKIIPVLKKFGAKSKAAIDSMFEGLARSAYATISDDAVEYTEGRKETTPAPTISQATLLTPIAKKTNKESKKRKKPNVSNTPNVTNTPNVEVSRELDEGVKLTACTAVARSNNEVGVRDLQSRRRCRASLSAVPRFEKGALSLLESLSRERPSSFLEKGKGKDASEVNEVKDYDAKRFSKYLATESKAASELSHDNLIALLLKYEHQVEKGLAMPPENLRLHFGVKSGVFSKLLKFCTYYFDKYGTEKSPFIFEGLGATLDQYVDLHNKKGVTADKIVHQVRQLLIDNNIRWESSDGGINVVSKDTLIEYGTKADFPSLVYARRSIRQYAPRLDDDSPEFAEFRDQVYDAIRLASEGTPSVCNRQGPKVVLIRDLQKIAAATEIQGGGKGHDVPEYMIMIQTNLQIFRESRERNQAYVDGGLFAMSLMYGLQSKGLATCSLNFAASKQKDLAMRELIGVDDSHVIVMFLAVGRYRDDVVYTVSPRRASQDIQSIVREV